jgi:stage II sporulation protein D
VSGAGGDLDRRSLLRGAVAAGLSLPFFGLLGCGRRGGGILLAAQGQPLVRVLLGAPRAAATLRISGPWEAVGSAAQSFRDAGPALDTQVAAGGSGIVFRGRASGTASMRLRPAAQFALDGVPYRGDLIVMQDGPKLLFVNELDLETYVAGVIVNEVGPGAVAATYRAQAVCARTYAFTKASDRKAAEASYHLFDDQKDQVYRGLFVPPGSTVTAADMERATLDTRGVILTWRSQPFPTYYSSTCGGYTTDARNAGLDPGPATEPLYGVPCRYCGSSKYFSWTENVAAQTILAALKARGVAAPLRGVEVTKVARSGHASEVTVTHGPGGATKVVPGRDFRSAAGLRSTKIVAIRTDPAGTVWQFTGSGWGHGAGMCQVGAIEMGRRGLSESDVLRYYYPGADFTRLY